MPVTKEYYDELHNAMADLVNYYSPDIEVLVNTINSYDERRGVFSLKPSWFDLDAPSYNKIWNLESFCEKTEFAAPDTVNYFFKLFCARLIIMALYTVYLQTLTKRLENKDMKDYISAALWLGGANWNINSLMDSGTSECRLEASVRTKQFDRIGVEHKLYIFLDNNYLLHTATIEDVLSGNIPVELQIFTHNELKAEFEKTITLNQLVQYIKQVIPFWQNN